MIAIIAAIAENGVIGKNGALPWRLPSDLKRFKRLTENKAVIAGRKTHEAILRRLGHPLKNRRTIVVTRNPRYASECEVAHSLREALELARNEDLIFIIGGGELYREALDHAEKMYLTRVKAAIDGDTIFPPFNESEWPIKDSYLHRRGEGDDFDHVLEIREKVRVMNLVNARYDDQRAVMEDLAGSQQCNFCPEHRADGQLNDPVWTGQDWIIVPNRWPYKFTKLHLLAIPNRHVIFPNELNSNEWAELFTLLDWAIREYRLEAGSIGLRFGNMHLTGATVQHLHVHLVVADPDTAKPGYERVRFAMGPKTPDKK